jgi:hypothetical protein
VDPKVTDAIIVGHPMIAGETQLSLTVTGSCDSSGAADIQTALKWNLLTVSQNSQTLAMRRV